jgi:hypothetical protein
MDNVELQRFLPWWPLFYAVSTQRQQLDFLTVQITALAMTLEALQHKLTERESAFLLAFLSSCQFERAMIESLPF